MNEQDAVMQMAYRIRVINRLKFELKAHQNEVTRLKSEIESLENLPNLLDNPLPFD